jgi:alanine dehydrogenase
MISDSDFRHAGALILDDTADVWAEADLLLKVKEPVGSDRSRRRTACPAFPWPRRSRAERALPSGVTPGTGETDSRI